MALVHRCSLVVIWCLPVTLGCGVASSETRAGVEAKGQAGAAAATTNTDPSQDSGTMGGTGASGTGGRNVNDNVTVAGSATASGGQATGGTETASGGQATGGTETSSGGQATGGRQASGGTDRPCEFPGHSADCSQERNIGSNPISWCGEDDVLHVRWYDFCGPDLALTMELTCTFQCPEACRPVGLMLSKGAEYVSAGCVESPLHVFVSSTAVPGDFGGLDGADEICQTAANDAGLEGEYEALMYTDVGLRPVWSHGRGGYARLDGGTVLEDDYYGVLLLPISVDETGASADPNTPVWMGTEPESDPAQNCGDWSSTDGVGAVGDATSLEEWTFATTRDCSQPAHFYCVEQ